MKAFLMHPDADFDLSQEPPAGADDLSADLELDTLITAMAAGDDLVFEVAKRALLTGLTEPEQVDYRQEVLRDCLDQPSVVRELYGVAVEAMNRERKIWGGLFKHPDSILRRSLDVMDVFVDELKKLRQIADDHASLFHSQGFSRLFGMLQDELNDDYFSEIADRLGTLHFRGGVPMSAHLGQGNVGTRYVLREPQRGGKPEWLNRLAGSPRTSYTWQLPDRDEAGARALGELRDRGLHLVANALAQACDHVLSFFRMLRIELAFYVGCLNLHERLTEKGERVCFPRATNVTTRTLSFDDLYDICLTLTEPDKVVGNDLQADGASLVVITGANQGGKSTFLRSVGLAQLMLQAGMFAPARTYRANLVRGVFTHYRREEDVSMRSGKLDEELARMSAIVDHLEPHSMVLFNESFASTNEREGSAIARTIIRALRERDIEVFFVTHFYDLAHGLFDEDSPGSLFLRAERTPDGHRTFKITEGEPLSTSFGQDLYNRIFAEAR